MIRVGLNLLAPVLGRAKRRGHGAYTRRRRPVARRSGRSVEAATVAAPRAPLPTAVLVRGAGAAQTFVGGVRGWMATRAAWLRPRAVPLVVAFAGMLGVLASVNYLSSMNPHDPTASRAQPTAVNGTLWLDPAAAATIRVVTR